MEKLVTSHGCNPTRGDDDKMSGATDWVLPKPDIREPIFSLLAFD